MTDIAQTEFDFYNALIDLETCYCSGKLQMGLAGRNRQIGDVIITYFSELPEDLRGKHFDEASKRLACLEDTDKIIQGLEELLNGKRKTFKSNS